MSTPDPGPALDALAVRGHRRGPRWTPVAYGLHYLTQDEPHEDLELAAWQLLMPGHGSFTGLTSARVRGWWLPPLPTGLPVFMALERNDPRPLRHGVLTSRHPRPVPHQTIRGLRCAGAAETLLACARLVGLLDLVVLLDAALHTRACTLEEVEAVLTPRRRGGPMLRQALGLADARSESAWETLLRLLHVVCGVDVEPQHEVLDSHGEFVARADLGVRGTTSIHEYDGSDHLPRKRQVADLRRLRRIAAAGRVRRGYTAEDLIHRPVTILRDADLALGRPHDPGLIRGWYALLAGSLFTPAGTAAFWKRIGGPPGAGSSGGGLH